MLSLSSLLLLLVVVVVVVELGSGYLFPKFVSSESVLMGTLIFCANACTYRLHDKLLHMKLDLFPTLQVFMWSPKDVQTVVSSEGKAGSHAT